MNGGVLDCGGKAISDDTAFSNDPTITGKAVSSLIALPPQSKTAPCH